MIRTVIAVVVALLVGPALLMPAEAAAEGGRRCHSLAPSCGTGAEPLCICPSRQASDADCKWICGVIG